VRKLRDVVERVGKLKRMKGIFGRVRGIFEVLKKL
jgi:hypothetical protein